MKFAARLAKKAARMAEKAMGLVKKADRKLSPKWLSIPMPVFAFTVMFLASAFIMWLETLAFHMLWVVNDYLLATSIIGIAMLGIAFGALLSFLTGKMPRMLTNTIAAVILFLSVIYSYYNIIAIGLFDYPYFLILPFICASYIISNMFASGGSAGLLYFLNLIGSGLGVALPLFLVPQFKSETSMMLLLLIPVAILFLLSLKLKNIIAKIPPLVFAIWAFFAVTGQVSQQMKLPETVPAPVFETKIMPELRINLTETRIINPQLDFLKRAYKKNAEGTAYVFSSDAYDAQRVQTLLKRTGLLNPFGIPFYSVWERRKPLDSWMEIPTERFEKTIARDFRKHYSLATDFNFDERFLSRVYKKDGDVYRLTGVDYEKLRAKYLLTELGHWDYRDINFDIRRHGSVGDRGKMYVYNNRTLLSEDHTLGRLEYTGDDSYMFMSINGAVLDGIDSGNGASVDPRVPIPAFLKNPKIFIIGLSADGIVKSAKRVPGAYVAGVELIPGIMRTMTEGIFAKFAHDPYQGLEAIQGEGRSYLETDPRKWDLISLMNIHTEHGPYCTLAPENLHTVEGAQLLLSKLTDRGILVYEEILMTPRSDLAFYKSLNTISEALRRSGAKNPMDHIHIFQWDFDPGALFRTLTVKRTPFTPEEARQMDAFVDLCKSWEKYYHGVNLMYSPHRTLNSQYEKFLKAGGTGIDTRLPRWISSKEMTDKIAGRINDPRDLEFMLSQYSLSGGYYTLKPGAPFDSERYFALLDQAGYPYKTDLRPSLDDRPYPFAVYKQKTETLTLLKRILVMSLILFLPLVFMIMRGAGAPKRVLLPGIAFTAVSGFGFMLVETILLQRFQLFIGDPTYSFVVVLGGLLVFSGLGSFASHFIPKKFIAILAALIPVALFIYLNFLSSWFGGFASTGSAGRIWVALAILFPLSFLMGMPFPTVIEMVKKRSDGDFAALLFGVSGGFATIASAAGFHINVTQGFTSSFVIGTICYTAGLAFFVMLLFTTRKKRAA